MLTNGSQWCVVTTHKENYSLLPAYLSYYRRYFGIRRGLIFCGRPPSRTHDSLKQLIALKLNIPVPNADKICVTPRNMELKVSEFKANDFVLWVASYPEDDLTGPELFKILLDLAAWGEAFLPEEITRTWVMDCDEFLYVKNPQILDNLDSLGFHFVDYVPSSMWPPDKMQFSLQGWYYNRQTRPIFKYGRHFAVTLAKVVKRGLQHNGCKTYFFDRKRLASWTSWQHSVSNSLCCCGALTDYLNDPAKCKEILRDTACCYHLAMKSKEYFLSERARLFSRLQVNMKKTSDQDPKAAERIFDRLIRQSIFPVIEDNFLLPYLQNPGMPVSG